MHAEEDARYTTTIRWGVPYDQKTTIIDTDASRQRGQRSYARVDGA